MSPTTLTDRGAAGKLRRRIGAPPSALWRALSEPESVAHWLGKIDAQFQPGELITLDLEHGEFVQLEVLGVDAPRELRYVWRLLEIGPKIELTFRLEPVANGTRLSLAVAGLVSGRALTRETQEWRRRLAALARFIETGLSAPATAPRDLEVGVELPAPIRELWATLRDPDVGRRLLALTGPLDEPGVRLRFGPGDDRVDAAVSHVEIDARRHRMAFSIEHPGSWATRCSVRVTSCLQGTRLAVRHGGWAEQPPQTRRTFVRFWHRFLLLSCLHCVRAASVPTVEVDEVEALLSNPDWLVLDSNRWTLWERGHIESAVFVGQEELPAEQLPEDRSRKLVFYCRDGVCLSAYLSALRARGEGFPSVYVMKGGREAWMERGLPLTAAE